MRPLLLALLAAATAAAQPLPSQNAPPSTDGLSPAGAALITVATPAALVGLGALLGADSGAAAPGLVLVGAVVGPATGNLVQGAWGDAAIGTGLRVLGAGALAGSVALAVQDGGVVRATLPAGALLLTGVSLAAYSVGRDVHTAAQNARAHRVTVAPSGAGLALRVGL